MSARSGRLLETMECTCSAVQFLGSTSKLATAHYQIIRVSGFMASPRVWIILSSYNGESFLDSLLASITSQTYDNWFFLVRDDGSTDSSKDIIEAFGRKHRDRFRWCEGPVGNIGLIESFGLLLDVAVKSASNDDLFMFADQDDLWSPEKITQFVSAYHEIAQYTVSQPVLVHSDLSIINSHGELLAGSLWDVQRLTAAGVTVEYLVVQNTVTACASMFNKALLDIAIPFPKGLIMHDWWLALIAVTAGKIVTLGEPLVKYRSHAGNVVGPKDYRFAYILKILLKFSRGRRQHVDLSALIVQARLVLSRIPAADPSVEFLSHFCSLAQMPRYQRILFLLKSGVTRGTLARNMALILDAMLLPRQSPRNSIGL